MIRCVERTRRKLNPDAVCCACKGVLEPGDRYRERVVIDEDIFDKSFVRDVAHTCCVSTYEEWEIYEEPPPWTKPPLGELTEKEQSVILHSLGMGSHIETSRHGYRTHYCANAGNELLLSMAEKGLMEAGGFINDGKQRYFRVTRKGGAAVGRPDLGEPELVVMS